MTNLTSSVVLKHLIITGCKTLGAPGRLVPRTTEFYTVSNICE